MWVIRRLRTDGFHLMEALEYKRAALLLYGLQIACSNLKNFVAEHPRPEAAEGERPQPKLVSREKEKSAAKGDGDEPSLAEFLLGLLAKGENGDPDAPQGLKAPIGAVTVRGSRTPSRAVAGCRGGLC